MAQLTINTPDLITFKEAAQILGVSRPTVYNRVRQKRLIVVDIGKNRYLWRKEVEKLKEEENDKETRNRRTTNII